jgi:hypothetical protein
MNHLNIRQAIVNKLITINEGLAIDNWLFEHEYDDEPAVVPEHLEPILMKILSMEAS